ncbi:DNA-methyltransferase [Arcticibacter svalbardensis MN12-7]|uniref:site-specific DNA-methyltransferase (adenine-specific) n=1 Tax=Arcticibacter svalbardensis MN12-7 TaxID=1150600 RepID=R9GU33_9SPHI|nr:DNA adenine methylase [Arcticibacter svalbardensis]EOR95372.1 DNA-methyltransferase [Arcticibacter svalbardensis MN12-7]
MLYSPLRYPGGKNKLSAFIAKICVDNKVDGHYVEPYSGGASVALFLLFEGFVKKITINDMDRSIYAFWYCVLNKTNELCELIERAEITPQEWRVQRKIQTNKTKASLLDLGFSTFFLNRTNRSGIIKAGIIGGIKQDGKYLMDCRFNKIELIDRIKKISKRRTDITLYQKDAVKLIDKIQKASNHENTVFYFDPPYYLKASSLYMNHYQDDNHKTVSEKIKGIKNIKWIVSYDNVPEIQALYQECTKKEFSFKHTAYESRLGQEILFFSPSLKQPEIENWDPLNFSIKRTSSDKNIIYKAKRSRKTNLGV